MLIQFPLTVNDVLFCEREPFVLMVRVPLTTRFLESVRIVVTTPPIVNDLQFEVLEIVGWLIPVKLASPMIASAEDVGTPAVQLLAVDQLVLVVPFQLVWAIVN